MPQQPPRIAFSEKALAERSRGAQLHALTSVRARWTWILFAVVTLCFATLIAWGFFGTVVNSVSGQAILLVHGGTRPVVAEGSGRLTQLNIRAGMRVSSGRVVGEIYNPQIIFNMNKLEMEYAQLCRQSEALTEGSAEMTRVRLALEQERERALASLTEKYDQSLARSRQRSASFATLRRQHAISQGDYFSSLDNLLNTEVQLMTNRLQVMLSSAQMQELNWEQKKTLITLENERLMKSLEVELARKLFRETFWVTADADGQVLELLKSQGDFVQQGETIALVVPENSQGLYLAGFLSPDAGKKVRAGMSAYFAPASVKSEEFGYIRGVVREVSEAPISAEAVVAELRNMGLAQSMTGGNAVIRVIVELLPDETTPSGFKWTSRKGAPEKLSNGLQGTLLVNTEYRRPASYLVPYARSVLFGS